MFDSNAIIESRRKFKHTWLNARSEYMYIYENSSFDEEVVAIGIESVHRLAHFILYNGLNLINL